MKLHFSVFDDGLISKWDHAVPRSRRFTEQEGRAVDIEFTPEQITQFEIARQGAAKITKWNGKVKLR